MHKSTLGLNRFGKNSINFFLRKIVLPLGGTGFARRRPSPAPVASASFPKTIESSLPRVAFCGSVATLIRILQELLTFLLIRDRDSLAAPPQGYRNSISLEKQIMYIKAFIFWIALTTGNFLWEVIKQRKDWSDAWKTSYFQAVALGIYVAFIA